MIGRILPEKIARSESLRILLIFLVLASVLIQKISDPDIWFHLTIGREILARQHIPGTEFYLFPMEGEKTLFNEWGYELAGYLIYDKVGYVGLALLNALLGAGALLLAFLSIRGAMRWHPVNIAMVFATAMLVRFRLCYRPEMSLYLCLGLELFVLEKWLEKKDDRILFWLPVIALALSNLHSSAIILVVVFVLYSLLGTPLGSETGRKGEFLFPALIISLMALATLANPYGLRPFLLPFELASQSRFTDSLVETLPTFRTEYRWPWLAAMSLFMVSAATGKGRRRLNFALLAVFGYLSFRYVRFLPLLFFAMYRPAFEAVSGLVQHLELLRRRTWRIALWSCVMILAGSALMYPIMKDEWGTGPDEKTTPIRSVGFIKRNHPPGRIFNFYHMGGFIAWNLFDEYSAFIDGRRGGIDKSVTEHNRILVGDGESWKLLDDYGINMIVSPATMPFSGELIPLILHLSYNKEWRLVVQEPAALLFLRKDAARSSRDVPSLDKSRIWQQVVTEAQATLREHPYSFGAYLSLAEAWEMTGDFPRARAAFLRYLEHDPGDEEARKRLRQLEETMGEMEARGQKVL